MSKEELEKLAKKIIGIAIGIHKAIGPGCLEKIYQRVFYLELKGLGVALDREVKIPIKWKRALAGYQVVDFIIAKELLIEVKAVSETQDLHKAQMLSYLKIADKRLGLILNFGREKLEIKRVVNNL